MSIFKKASQITKSANEDDNAVATYMVFGMVFGMIAGMVFSSSQSDMGLFVSLGLSIGMAIGIACGVYKKSLGKQSETESKKSFSIRDK